jgi:hypothetical protein
MIILQKKKKKKCIKIGCYIKKLKSSHIQPNIDDIIYMQIVHGNSCVSSLVI